MSALPWKGWGKTDGRVEALDAETGRCTLSYMNEVWRMKEGQPDAEKRQSKSSRTQEAAVSSTASS